MKKYFNLRNITLINQQRHQILLQKTKKKKREKDQIEWNVIKNRKLMHKPKDPCCPWLERERVTVFVWQTVSLSKQWIPFFFWLEILRKNLTGIWAIFYTCSEREYHGLKCDCTDLLLISSYLYMDMGIIINRKMKLSEM